MREHLLRHALEPPALVSTSVPQPSTIVGVEPVARSRTVGRLRADLRQFASPRRSRAERSSRREPERFRASRHRLGLGASNASESTTHRVPPRRAATAPSAERRRALHLARQVGAVVARLGAERVPPPGHQRRRVEPTRARPVPFCLNGFLPPPRHLGARLLGRALALVGRGTPSPTARAGARSRGCVEERRRAARPRPSPPFGLAVAVALVMSLLGFFA